MKICQVWGDMSADRFSDCYPTVPICDDCFDKYENESELIIHIHSETYTSGFGDECYYCDKSIEEEQEEKI